MKEISNNFCFNLNKQFNELKYKEALSAKVMYLKSLYEKLNKNTVMIITSDTGKKTLIIKLVSRIETQSKDSKYLPFFVVKKGSNFSSDEFTIYSEKNKPILNPEDIASTISSLLGVKIPKMNQGKFNEEVIQLNNFSELETKINYLELRNQLQKLDVYLLKCIFLKKFNLKSIVFSKLDNDYLY